MTTTTAIRNEDQAISYLQEIDVLDNLAIVDGKVAQDASCHRCGGKGYLNAFGHIEGGRCFACHGANTVGLKKYTPIKKYAQKLKAKNKAADKRNAEATERNAKREEKMLEGQRNWCEKNGFDRITFEEKTAMEAEKREANKGKSQHFAQVKDRVEITAKILAVPHFDTQWGRTYIYIMVTEEGNKVIWKTSAGFNARRGDMVTFKATVKENGERDGEKQTVVTRCKEIV